MQKKIKDDTISRQEAIETAENVAYACDEHGSAECWLAMLINSLEVLSPAQPEQQWIPCSDPSDLPKDKRLWITREISDGFFTLREVSDVIWDMTEWSGSVSGVVAYMPYWEPEPYKERREE